MRTKVSKSGPINDRSTIYIDRFRSLDANTTHWVASIKVLSLSVCECVCVCVCVCVFPYTVYGCLSFGLCVREGQFRAQSQWHADARKIVLLNDGHPPELEHSVGPPRLLLPTGPQLPLCMGNTTISLLTVVQLTNSLLCFQTPQIPYTGKLIWYGAGGRGRSRPAEPGRAVVPR